MKIKQSIIFIDSGDTIVDESTEVRDYNGIVIKTGLIPGASRTLKMLKDQGYIIVLVADGLKQSFINIFNQHNLTECFDAVVDSETIGSEKPGPEIFQKAMDLLGLPEEDKKRIVMIGNNLERDIAGANSFGITSIFLDWTPRYRKKPESSIEIPDVVLHFPMELVDYMSDFEMRLGE